MQKYIQEWNTFDLTNVFHAPYVITLTGVFGLFLWRFIRTKEMVYERFGALLFFAWAAARHSRHIPFFIMTALPYAAGMLGAGPAEGPNINLRRALQAAAPAWLAENEYRYFRPADSANIVLPVLEGEIRYSELEKEIRRYLKSNTVYYEGSSVTAEVLNYQSAIKELCKDKNAKCRP